MEEKRVSPEANVDRKKVGRPRGPSKVRIKLAKDLCERHGVDPLSALLMMVKNRRLPIQVRLDAAKAACPFVYPKLSAIAVNLKDDNKAQFQDALLAVMSNPERLREAQTLSLAVTKAQREQATPAGLPAPPDRQDIKDANIIDAEFSDLEQEN